jgi:hypothetical protein
VSPCLDGIDIGIGNRGLHGPRMRCDLRPTLVLVSLVGTRRRRDRGQALEIRRQLLREGDFFFEAENGEELLET